MHLRQDEYTNKLLKQLTRAVHKMVAQNNYKKMKTEQANSCIHVSIEQRTKTSFRFRLIQSLFENNKPICFSISKIDINTAQAIQLQIQRDINNAELDPTLEKYKQFKKYEIKKTKIVTLGELWNDYLAYKEPLIAPSTYKIKYVGTYSNAIEDIGRDKKINKDTALCCRNWLIENRSKRIAGEILARLSEALSVYIDRELYFAENHFRGMSQIVGATNNRVVDNSSIDNDSQKIAFTADERNAVIQWFREFEPLYTDFVIFRFYSAARFGESVELRWCDISKDGSVIKFRRSYAEASDTVQPTKTGKVRSYNIPPVLRGILGQRGLEKDLVFTSATGMRIDRYDLRKRWRKCMSELLNSGAINQALPLSHTRHTAVTLARLTNDPSAVAAQFGHSRAVADAHYNDTSNVILDFD
jgi:integrase